MVTSFHQLCPKYSGPLTPIPKRLLGSGKLLPLVFMAVKKRDNENGKLTSLESLPINYKKLHSQTIYFSKASQTFITTLTYS